MAMAEKTVKCSLSISGIRQMQEEIKRYRSELTLKCREFAAKLAERGAGIARVQVAGLDAVFTGELIDSIHSEHKENRKYGAVFAVVAGTDHCMFVEFGTGWKGKNSPYPYPLPDGVSWEYNTGKTIRYNSKKGTYYWFYPGRDGNWHYTEGMPARPFMFHTAMELRDARILEETAREVFGK